MIEGDTYQHRTAQLPAVPVRISRAALLAGLSAAAVVTSAYAHETIKAGLWRFTSQGGPQQGGQQIGSNFMNCIDPARSVPVDPKLSCRVDGMNRNGMAITWATTCNTPQGTFQSKAVAQYTATTMSGTLTTAVSVVGQLVQQTSGRYLGPCTR